MPNGIHAHDRYKLGLLPADPVALSRMIRLDLSGADIAGMDIPPLVSHLDAVQPLMVLGANDRFGTCWPTSIANHAIMVQAACTSQRVTVTDEDVFALYRAAGNPSFDPETGQGDNGVDPTAGFAALMREGITVTHLTPAGDPDPQSKQTMTPVCYASYDVTSLADTRAVTYAAGGSLFALDLQTAQQAQTDAHPPLWAYSKSGQWGGHAVLGGSYTAPGRPDVSDEVVETWQMQVATTDAFLTHQLDAAYVAIWRELWSHDAFASTVDRHTLAEAYQAVTHRPISAPGQ